MIIYPKFWAIYVIKDFAMNTMVCIYLWLVSCLMWDSWEKNIWKNPSNFCIWIFDFFFFKCFCIFLCKTTHWMFINRCYIPNKAGYGVYASDLCAYTPQVREKNRQNFGWILDFFFFFFQKHVVWCVF